MSDDESAGTSPLAGGADNGGTPPSSSRPTPDPAGDDDFIVARLGDLAINAIRGLLTESLFNAGVRLLVLLGHISLLAVTAYAFILAIVFAAKQDSFQVFLYGAAAVPALLVIHYTACKFLKAPAVLIAANPSHISTPAFTDCVGLLALIGGVICLVYGIVTAIQLESLDTIWQTLLVTLLLLYVACVALNPGLLNITVAPRASAAQEAIAILGFAAKAYLRLVPVIFGAGVFLGAVELVLVLRHTLGEHYDAWGTVYFASLAAYTKIVFAALAPLMIYIAFLILYFFLDLANSVLRAANLYADTAERGRRG